MAGRSARLVAVGDNVVDCYPDLGVMYPGGNMVNVAVHARRCGADSAYVGATGRDVAGELVRSSLAAEGVDTGFVRTEQGPNAFAIVRVVDGDRIFAGGDVGVSRFVLGRDDLALLAEADVVHTGECSMLEEQLPAIRRAARFLSFDFSERPEDYVLQHAPLVDMAVLSAPEQDAEPVALARRVAALGPGLVAVTQGRAGATLFVDGEAVHVPAEARPVVDTLGAGDAFIARLLVGIARNERLPALLSAATGYATATCGSYGAFGYRTPLPQELAAVTSGTPVPGVPG